ncbi:MAG: hypothetical protein OXH11_00280, partial [Candidatus Aminicenantes bacterium]|nr:hypothetical protein [Candidatus Aminicenantes bacterium]
IAIRGGQPVAQTEQIGHPLLVPRGQSAADWLPRYQETMDALKEYCESYPWNRERGLEGSP